MSPKVSQQHKACKWRGEGEHKWCGITKGKDWVRSQGNRRTVEHAEGKGGREIPWSCGGSRDDGTRPYEVGAAVMAKAGRVRKARGHPVHARACKDKSGVGGSCSKGPSFLFQQSVEGFCALWFREGSDARTPSGWERQGWHHVHGKCEAVLTPVETLHAAGAKAELLPPWAAASRACIANASPAWGRL